MPMSLALFLAMFEYWRHWQPVFSRKMGMAVLSSASQPFVCFCTTVPVLGRGKGAATTDRTAGFYGSCVLHWHVPRSASVFLITPTMQICGMACRQLSCVSNLTATSSLHCMVNVPGKKHARTFPPRKVKLCIPVSILKYGHESQPVTDHHQHSVGTCLKSLKPSRLWTVKVLVVGIIVKPSHPISI